MKEYKFDSVQVFYKEYKAAKREYLDYEELREILDVLEKDNFFCIVSAGDDKAFTGQTGLMAVFDADGVPYTHEEWSA